ncbi:glycosyltransferase family 2 protein [Patescibacteria group bacterium]|nr:glycosyltransferase family 2 protein [Patescibacteria group bacterium]MBU1663523.1 glycosyltransferase family 2 protein [Patescibacteria group bacterium]MBU1933785.1 glycosyltransferase family 2 protein [Patescibacteria group bacterium]MBU2007823.1 glycosyltransferase family 2 protein [Patescibacteria group bacterium]MBU2233427.1 glycosyltransferase family 2 protein [Patescibacteria group bacterium]
MDLSIIIVSWNVKEKLKNNLRALFESQGVNFEVFVVDNDSHDSTVEMVKKYYPRIYPVKSDKVDKVKLIVNRENLGFAKANNQAIKQASGRYVLLLNPDMRVFNDTLSRMISWMDQHDQAWIAGCKLVDENARIIKQVRRFPALADQLAIILKIPHIFPAVLNKYLNSDFDYTKSASVDSIRGGFFMIRKQVIEKIGMIDERFFLWFEEVDYCRRVKAAGGEIWYMPTAECIDLMGQSFKQVKLAVKQKYFRDSMLKYFKKWQPSWQYWILKIAWLISLLIVMVGEKFKIRQRGQR